MIERWRERLWSAFSVGAAIGLLATGILSIAAGAVFAVLTAGGASIGSTPSPGAQPAPEPTVPPVASTVAPNAAPAPSPAKPEPSAAPPVPPPPTEAEKSPPPPPPPAEPARPRAPADLTGVSFEELRQRANNKDARAMEELGRRLIQGVGTAPDPQAGAGWLLRAAESGSAQAAFNVGVMYERGFVVERDSTRAVEWYRKAAAADLAVAKHNLALLLRDGRGAARDGKAAVELLRAAALQGTTASMFVLGDIYERGDVAPKDDVAALAWFGVTSEFELRAHRGTETPLAASARERMQALQRTLTAEEQQRAQTQAQAEFQQIVDALTPAKPAPGDAPPPVAGPPAPKDEPPGWPKSPTEQVKAIQTALVNLKLLRAKPDGSLGPMTRAAIRKFQQSAGLAETGEPTKEVYAALLIAAGHRDTVETSPFPRPPSATAETPPAPSPAPAPAPPPASVPAPPPAPAPAPAPTAAPAPAPAPEPSPPSPADTARTAPPPAPPRVDPAPPPKRVVLSEKPPEPRIETAPPPRRVEIAAAEPPPPLRSSEFAKPESKPGVKPDAGPSPPKAPGKPPVWPASRLDQIKLIQNVLRELHFYNGSPDGKMSATTRNAIRDYQRTAGLKETGEPSKALYDSLNEMHALMAPK